MMVGAPFNPYKVFQGVFAPYWVLEHRGISAGAKLCYIRLLGFGGRDARCYPSLETLGAGLGVSGRQARAYVKELERAGLITVDQRGLRKTCTCSCGLPSWTGCSGLFPVARPIPMILKAGRQATRILTGTPLPLLTGTVVPV